jgi:hypothetical protein
MRDERMQLEDVGKDSMIFYLCIMARRETHKRYLTKQMVDRAAKSSASQAFKSTMKRMGSTVMREGNAIVRRYSDGRVDFIHKLDKKEFSNLHRIVD